MLPIAGDTMQPGTPDSRREPTVAPNKPISAKARQWLAHAHAGAKPPGEVDPDVDELSDYLTQLDNEMPVSYTHLTLPTTPYV